MQINKLQNHNKLKLKIKILFFKIKLIRIDLINIKKNKGQINQ